ncbi:MAG: ABC transporter permease [Oscillospiraceae bacterium]|nr:ABC transporter permease [Oscillospiraceae bacterium]
MIQTLKMAMKSISGNKMRSFLTMLGIIIGVMALVVLVSLVNGATSTVTDTVNSLGTDLLTVTVSDDYGNLVTLDTLQEWATEDGIGDIAPAETTSATVKYDSDSDTATVYGTTASYYDVEGLELSLGRFLKTTDVDNNNYVCVVSQSLAEDLVGYLDCLGEEISLDGMKFTIVGVLADDDSSLTSVLTSGTLAVYIPYTTLLRISDSISSDITTFYVSAAEDSDTDTAESVITSLLLERFEEDSDAFEVSNSNVLEDTMSSITSILTIMLGGIAGISLLVGGIGIMNIMLVSVTERTREIGIRKSIGASRGVILRQFLMEAVALCMMGCLIGIFISWVILKLASVVVSSLSMSFDMNGPVVLIAVVFCFIIGLIFGLYPANKAAKMKPIDALHYGG